MMKTHRYYGLSSSGSPGEAKRAPKCEIKGQTVSKTAEQLGLWKQTEHLDVSPRVLCAALTAGSGLMPWLKTPKTTKMKVGSLSRPNKLLWGGRPCDDGTLHKGKYWATSHCKSFCSDKNPCFTVKKKMQSCLNMNIELSFCPGWGWELPSPHYNSMSWASSSEKSDIELSEEESPPPSSCSFRASSVAYRWMYSGGENQTDTQTEWSLHDKLLALLNMFDSNLPQRINFNQRTNEETLSVWRLLMLSYLWSCVYNLLVGGGTGLQRLHSEDQWG